MTRTFFMTVIATLCLAGPLLARADASEEELQKATEEYNANVDDPRDEVICKKVAKTGSRIKEKRCRTRAQWELEAEEGKRFVDKPRPVVTRD